MTPSEWNHWLAFILIGLPLARVAGPFAWSAIWILAGCALATLHPLLGLALAGLWLLRKPARWFFDAVAVGLAARLTGVFNSPERAELAREKFARQRSRQHAPRQPRAPYKRGGRYFPWQGEGPNDDIPFGD
jgi:hypothetical protein